MNIRLGITTQKKEEEDLDRQVLVAMPSARGDQGNESLKGVVRALNVGTACLFCA